MDFSKKICVTCEGIGKPLEKKKILEFLKSVKGWNLSKKKISRTFVFKDFKEAMKFVNNVAALAEREGHHPDFSIHWNEVHLLLWTHAINGLSENDFVLAAKINLLL